MQHVCGRMSFGGEGAGVQGGGEERVAGRETCSSRLVNLLLQLMLDVSE